MKEGAEIFYSQSNFNFLERSNQFLLFGGESHSKFFAHVHSNCPQNVFAELGTTHQHLLVSWRHWQSCFPTLCPPSLHGGFGDAVGDLHPGLLVQTYPKCTAWCSEEPEFWLGPWDSPACAVLWHWVTLLCVGSHHLPGCLKIHHTTSLGFEPVCLHWWSTPLVPDLGSMTLKDIN